MDILIAFLFGAFLGSIATAFMIGASATKRDYENYMEGFIAGLNDENK